jgi:hypothetical protein
MQYLVKRCSRVDVKRFRSLSAQDVITIVPLPDKPTVQSEVII